MSSQPDPLDATTRWLRYAAEDLADAQALLFLGGGIPRNICMLAQQSSEKAIKAFLLYMGIRFPKAHDLERLVSLMPELDAFSGREEDLAWLTTWSGQGKYPGDLPEGAHSDANRAVDIAEEILRIIDSDLAKRTALATRAESLPE